MLNWRELWTAVKSQLPDRRHSLRKHSIKAKNRLQKKRKQFASSGSRKLNIASISKPLPLHEAERQIADDLHPYPRAPPSSLHDPLSDCSSDQDLDISSLILPEPLTSESSFMNHTFPSVMNHTFPASVIVERPGKHTKPCPRFYDQHLSFDKPVEPTVDEIDAYCLGFIQGPYLKTALGAGQLPVSHEPLASHPTQPTIELFYPALYRSVALSDGLSDGKNAKLSPAYTSATFVPRAPELHAACSSVGDTTPAMTNDCELFACGSRLDSRPRFLLEHTMHLYGPRDRRPVKTLVTQMDITDSLRKLAVHLLRNVSDEALSMSLSAGSVEHDPIPREPSGEPIQRRWRDSGIDMDHAPRTSVSESTSTSCSVDDDSSMTGSPPPLIAPAPSRSVSQSPPFAPPAMAHALHELHEFIADIRYLYRDAFILTPAPGSQYWQIAQTTSSLQAACWPLRTLSARNFTSGDAYPWSRQASSLSASLIHTDAGLLYQLGQHMAARRPVETVVQWGSTAPGRQMRMYCVPLLPPSDADTSMDIDDTSYGHDQTESEQQCWVCWLTDVRVPDLWALESARNLPCW